jgi:hypothetical protein
MWANVCPWGSLGIPLVHSGSLLFYLGKYVSQFLSLQDSWDHPGALWLIVVYSRLECGPFVALMGLLGSPGALWLIVVHSRQVWVSIVLCGTKGITLGYSGSLLFNSRLECGPIFVLEGLLGSSGALWFIVVHSRQLCGPMFVLAGLLRSPWARWLNIVQSRQACGPIWVFAGLLWSP